MISTVFPKESSRNVNRMNATSKPKDARSSKRKQTNRRLLESCVLNNGFLARLQKLVPWEKLSLALEEVKTDEGSGRKGYDRLVLFKCLILQEAYGLSDKALESALKDRLSFRFFTGIGLSPAVPGRLTITRFRNRLAVNDLYGRLFARLNFALKERGLSLYVGTNSTGSNVKTPRLRRTVRKAGIKEK